MPFATATQIVVHPPSDAGPDIVREAERAGNLGGRMVPLAEHEALRHRELIEEINELIGREKAVVPGVGQQHGRVAGVDLRDGAWTANVGS